VLIVLKVRLLLDISVIKSVLPASVVVLTIVLLVLLLLLVFGFLFFEIFVYVSITLLPLSLFSRLRKLSLKSCVEQNVNLQHMITITVSITPTAAAETIRDILLEEPLPWKALDKVEIANSL